MMHHVSDTYIIARASPLPLDAKPKGLGVAACCGLLGLLKPAGPLGAKAQNVVRAGPMAVSGPKPMQTWL